MTMPQNTSHSAIPSEILGIIFSYCLPNLLGNPQAQSFRQARGAAPLALLRVCRRWNEVVVSTPVLWTCIAVEQTKQGCAPPLPVLQQWLKRSAACGLSLDVLVHPEYSSEDAAQMLRILLTAYHRWREVRLCIPTSLQHHFALQDDILIVNTTPAPMLESLSITLEAGEFGVISPLGVLDVDDIVERAPRLTRLAWIYEYPMPTFRAAVGWSRLIHITSVAARSLWDCYAFLQACPQLLSCHLMHVDLGWEQDGEAAPLRLSRLQSLRIIAKGVDFQPLLDLLTLPSLRMLELSRLPPQLTAAPAFLPLSQLMLRSAFALEHLVLHNMALDAFELVGLLKLLSESLTELDVFDVCKPITEHVINALTINPEATVPPPEEILCPQLEVIKLRGGVIANDGKLIDMVRSRRHSDANSRVGVLRDIHVEFADGGGFLADHCRDRTGLEELRSEGLRAYIF
ncbi:hypothetical protein HGRIS_003954 [Hohenbuehelia grisea]|uniref:F-box domain-containing protein n=1 Tax=Hohenbuehelia grisea TaxID=104357 RepID=A0ABR3JHZ0_9AGAR